jgi:hypothetical protein
VMVLTSLAIQWEELLRVQHTNMERQSGTRCILRVLTLAALWRTLYFIHK